MAINLNDFSYTPSVKPITPKDVYGERLSEIPKTIKGLWKIIDFRPPQHGEYFITDTVSCVARQGYAFYDVKNARFIVQALLPRLPYSDTERMDLIERLGNSYIAPRRGDIVVVTRANLDKILDDEFAAQEKE